jgi:hypothetical protein
MKKYLLSVLATSMKAQQTVIHISTDETDVYSTGINLQKSNKNQTFASRK